MNFVCFISFYGILSYKDIYLKLSEVDQFRMLYYHLKCKWQISACELYPWYMQINSVRRSHYLHIILALKLLRLFMTKNEKSKIYYISSLQ